MSAPSPEPLRIAGAQLYRLEQFRDDRGRILKAWREDGEWTFHWRIGEVYLSTVYPNVVKAWHRHSAMTLRYACVRGTVRVCLYDDRPASPSKGAIQTVFLSDGKSPERYGFQMLVIPPMVWNGFRSFETEGEAIILNLPDLPHDPEEIERVHPRDFPLESLRPYWGDYEEAG